MSFSKHHFLAKTSEIKSDIEKLEAAIIDAVYVSNMIEGVGLNRNITASLCGDAFRGVEVISAEYFDETIPITQSTAPLGQEKILSEADEKSYQYAKLSNTSSAKSFMATNP